MSETLSTEVWIDGLRYWKVGDTLIAPISGGETPPNTGEGDPPPPDPQTGKDGKPFDAERAQRTIDQLREEIKGLKANSKELDTAKAKLKEIEDAGKSELERATAKATEEEQKRTAAEQRAADLALQIVVERTAGKMGFHDPDDAYRLIDRRAVEMGEDGEPKNVEALLKKLAESKPHLVKTAEGDEKKPPAAQKSPPPTPKPNGKPPTRDELVKEKYEKLKASGTYSRM